MITMQEKLEIDNGNETSLNLVTKCLEKKEMPVSVMSGSQ